jgi:hypothetical protein
VLSPFAANADPITFEMDFSGTAGSPDGFFQIDDSLIIPGAKVYFSAFDEFELVLDTISVSFAGGDFFEDDAGVLFDGVGDFLGWFDDSDNIPQFIEATTQLRINWTSLGEYAVGANNDFVNPIESGIVTVTRVPEPGTLALLGIGLAGMGLARRRRKV